MSYGSRDSTLNRNKNYSSTIPKQETSNKTNYGLLDDVPDYGSAFVCGKSRFESEKFHVKNDPILQMSCGDEHTGLITKSGRIFMFGSNNWGQLGLGHENNVEKPSCIKSLKQEVSILIACGRNHTIIATEKGSLYAFGCNSESQLGLGDTKNTSFFNSPQRIEGIGNHYWKALSAGAGQSCALTENGDLFVWGINDNGELGIGKQVEQPIPKRLDLGFEIRSVSCGYYHTAIVSKSGDIYTAGSDEYFQLGHQRSAERKFCLVEKVNEPVRHVSCGAGHTMFLTKDGYVYALGDGSKGQLGLGTEILCAKSPRLVNSLEPYVINKISAGECHTAFITDKGKLFTSGDNRYGKLGLNQKTFDSIQFTPILVDKYAQLNVDIVACGGCHMILKGAIGKKGGKYSDDENETGINSIKGSSLGSKYNTNKTLMTSTRFKENDNLDRYANSLTKNALPDLYGKSPRQGNYSSRTEEPPKKSMSKKFNDSESEMDNEEAEFTFNRTHTLTRDHGFVPLSETNLKKAAEESMSKFSSHKTRPDFFPNRNRFDDAYESAKKPEPKSLSRFGNASDSEDEFLFNRKNYSKDSGKTSFDKYSDNKPGLSLSSRSHTDYSVKPYNSGPKSFGTSKSRVSEESDDEGRVSKGFSSERNRVRRTSYEPPKKTNDAYRSSSTDVRNFRGGLISNGQRGEMAKKNLDDKPKIVEQADTRCFKKGNSSRSRERNNLDDNSRRTYDEREREKPKLTDKIKTCSIL